MATEKGIVVKTLPTHALVQSTKSSSCESCTSRDACNVLGGGNHVEIEALNPINAHVGDRVLLSIKPASLFKMTFLLYMLPVIFLLFGAIIGEKLSVSLPYDSSLVAALMGFLFFFLSLGVVVITGRRLEKKKEYRPEIIRILQPEHTKH